MGGVATRCRKGYLLPEGLIQGAAMRRGRLSQEGVSALAPLPSSRETKAKCADGTNVLHFWTKPGPTLMDPFLLTHRGCKAGGRQPCEADSLQTCSGLMLGPATACIPSQ